MERVTVSLSSARDDVEDYNSNEMVLPGLKDRR